MFLYYTYLKNKISMNNLSIKKDEYIAKIIHDIENPTLAQITALESFLTTAYSKISQEEKDLIELTLNSCKHMYKFIEVFNLVYRLNFEPLKLNYEKFDFVELVQDLIKELEILIKYYELNLELNCEEKIVIYADKIQIKRVVENLLSNSINYAFKNSKIKIVINVYKNKILFKVINNSPYIESETLKEVFDKHKIQALYNKNGVGLGLYLSKEIVNAHGGEMIANSFPDSTCVFGFEVPVGG